MAHDKVCGICQPNKCMVEVPTKNEYTLAIVPVGGVVPYAGSDTPNGNWLICNGASVSAATYPELYAAIGSKYGGNSTNFNLPNLQGKVPIGVSSSHALASTGGAETHTLTTAQMPSHNHGLGSHIHSIPSHTHTVPAHSHNFTYYDGSKSGSTVVGTGNPSTSAQTGTTSSSGGGNTGSWSGTTGASSGNTANVGSGDAHNNMQPFITLNYIIRAK